MKSEAATVEEYLAALPEDRRVGLYASEPELAWFEQQYAERGLKLDMGKSCVRFKRLDEVPLDVIGETIARTPPATFIERYEAARAQTSRGR